MIKPHVLTASSNHLESHAREMLGASPEWKAYEWEALGGTAKTPPKLITVQGAVAPIKQRGKYKGEPDWKRLDVQTQQTAYITPAEHEAWLLKWEADNGKCHKCQGTGQVFASWSSDGGAKTRTCCRCGGTGAPPAKEEKEASHGQA